MRLKSICKTTLKNNNLKPPKKNKKSQLTKNLQCNKFKSKKKINKPFKKTELLKLLSKPWRQKNRLHTIMNSKR